MYIDSHAHFDLMLEETGISEDMLLSGMRDSGVDRVVQISIDLPSAHWSYDFAKRRAAGGIQFTAGIHPSSAADDNSLNELRTLAERVVSSADSRLLFGIGECGLDFYRNRQPHDMQERSFRFQIDLANRLGLPVIVHSRDAMEESLEVLRNACKTTGIMHCFPGDRDAARKVLDLGFYLSFAGNVTYRNAKALHESAAYVPLDRLLVETDAPFLTPVPMRGKKNRPGYVVHTYRFIAELRGDAPDRIAEAVRNNFMELQKHAPKNV